MILVTGGAGFIGSNFIHHLRSSQPHQQILVIDKLTYAADPSQIDGLEDVELIVGDIQDMPLIQKVLGRGVDAIFHFAAESHVDRSIDGPAAFIQTNILGTFSLLESARIVWAGDRSCRFLHVSTDEVFGTLGDAGRFSEVTPYAPNSPYSASKAGSDHLVRAYHHTFGMATRTTNCSNNYGPRQHVEKLIPLAISRMVRGEAVPVYGDGQNVRDWLFVDDHCTGLLKAMEHGLDGETYCLGGDNELRNLDLLHQLADIVDQALGQASGTSRRLLTFVKDRAGHDRRYAIDASRAREELGWLPQTSFQQGLERTVAWYLGRMRKA